MDVREKLLAEISRRPGDRTDELANVITTEMGGRLSTDNESATGAAMGSGATSALLEESSPS